jgi:hypothetical protein
MNFFDPPSRIVTRMLPAAGNMKIALGLEKPTGRHIPNAITFAACAI